MTSSGFVTIVTPSRLAYARVAMRDLVSGGRAPRRVVVVLGSTNRDEAIGIDGVEVRHAEAWLAADAVAAIVADRTAAEACFALKPLALSALAAEGLDRVHYIDSDVRFLADAAPLDAALTDADVLLTPHYLDPFPDDGHRPRVLTLLRGGAFNAGYAGVRNTPGGLAFLRWWADHVRRFGDLEPRKGMSGDQRWLDLAPALFPGCRVLRHPGANVAYWNLHERRIAETPAGWTSNGEPLLFFHFSGFDPMEPLALSKYQDRVDVRGDAGLSKLLQAYAADLAAAGWSRERGARYAWHRWWHGDSRPARAWRRWMRRDRR